MTMKLPCAAVRDLLPLYAEKMTEPETRALIEAHLQECPACRKKLAELENASSPAIDTAAPLRSVKKEIRRRRWYAALTAALLVFVSILTYFYHADSLKPLPWQEGLAAVKGVRTIASEDEYTHAVRITRGDENLLEPGKEALVIKLDSLITGTQMQMSQEDDGTLTAILQGFARNASLGQTLSRQEGEMLIYPVPDRLIYGFEAAQQFLWGDPLNGGGAVLPRLALSAYLLIAAALAALS
ncbi:MAG: zf-HC2 domain-containing protein, partial [Clostridia bacterium]|nr:zf-HC2 domain-containing protein [Clostridia bacterium]